MSYQPTHPRLRIKTVDMDGFAGRDYHPAKADEGKVVTPIQMAAYLFDEDGDTIPLFGLRAYETEDEVPTLHPAAFERLGQHDGAILWLYTCVTDDGRVLELIDHEVEAIDDGPPLQEETERRLREALAELARRDLELRSDAAEAHDRASIGLGD